MQRSVLTSLWWTYGSVATNGLLQILFLAFASRFLGPKEFGTVAICLILNSSIRVLLQSGIERLVVWSKALSEDLLRTIMWLSVSATGLACAAIVAASFAVTYKHENPEIFGVLALYMAAIFVNTLGLTSRGVLRREMKFRSLSIIDIVSYGLGYFAVGLLLAMKGYGAKSLAFAAVAQAVLQSAMLVKARPIFPWGGLDFLGLKSTWKFGAGLSAVGLLEFLDTQIGPIFISRFLGLEALGLFNRAYSLAQLPLEQIGVSLTRVLFTPLSAARGDMNVVFISLRRPLALLSLGVFTAIACGAVAAPTIVLAVLGSNWMEAAPIFAAVCVGAGFAVVGNLVATVNEALGVVRRKFVAQLLVTSCFAICLLLFARSNILTVAILLTLSRAVFLISQIYLASAAMNRPQIDIYKIIIPSVLCACLSATSLYGVLHTPLISHLAPLPALLFAVCFSGFLLILFGAVVSSEFRFVSTTLLRKIGLLRGTQR
ncbi:MAG: oligosaccharide flippase family protein [Sneathiella sp.]|nr:oligosaccharide flippase family protein [Sneathiella sp.]